MRPVAESREPIALLAGAMPFHLRFVVIFCSARLLWAGAVGVNLSPASAK